MSFRPGFKATFAGSLPLAGAEEAVELILAHLPELPGWPQLIPRSPWEDMILQAAPGLPGLKVDLEARTVRIDPDQERTLALTEFYQADLEGRLDRFGLTEEVAPGFFALVRRASGERGQIERLKGQVTGPITFCLSVKDSTGRVILYDQELAEACARGLGLKGAWQVANFPKELESGLIFLDEPGLTGFGSAFLNLDRQTALSLLNAATQAIQEAGGLVGVHVCGNTDWSLVLTTQVDVVNFDAYAFGEGFLLYAQDIEAFLNRGGVIAWGIVPTTMYTPQVSAEELVSRLEELIGRLVAHGIKRAVLEEQSLLTASCGLGSISPPTALAVLELLSKTSRLLRG